MYAIRKKEFYNQHWENHVKNIDKKFKIIKIKNNNITLLTDLNKEKEFHLSFFNLVNDKTEERKNRLLSV